MSIALPEWARGLGEWASVGEIAKASNLNIGTLRAWRMNGRIRFRPAGHRDRPGRPGFDYNVSDVVKLTLAKPASAPGRRLEGTGHAFRLFIDAKTSAGMSGATMERYHYTLLPFVEAFPYLPREPEPVEKYLSKWENTSTRYTKAKTLRTFYAWLERRKMIDPANNPFRYMEGIQNHRAPARGLSEEELRQLFAYTGHSPHMRLFLSLMLDTGVRIGEALSITRSDVKDATLFVDGKVGPREVPVSPEIRDQLRVMLPWPWESANSAGQLVRRAFRLAGLDGKRASAHTLRVTFARMWTGDKIALQGIGGWRSVTMLNHYRPYNIHEAVEEHRKHSPLHLIENLDEAASEPTMDVDRLNEIIRTLQEAVARQSAGAA